jgi:hypothetical protein
VVITVALRSVVGKFNGSLGDGGGMGVALAIERRLQTLSVGIQGFTL